jgi:threonine dehydrogenase-like Zn-dependent dehydrogenase
MRAVRNTADGISVLDLPTPDAGSLDDHVLVTVGSTAICGSDLHLISFGPMPVTLGHEFAGTLNDGTPVAVRPQVPCGTCDLCAADAGNLCRTINDRLYGVSLDGGMADTVLVHKSTLVPLPEQVPVSLGALVEPLAVAAHGVRRFGVTGGMRVLVIGGGPIGLCAVAAARDAGALVDLAEPQAFRLDAGVALGAGTTTTGDYDVVIDAAGVQGSFEQAVEKVRPRGVLGQLATYWAPVAMGFAAQMKEITLIPAITYTADDFAQSARILAGTPDLAKVLVSHRFGLDEAARAFEIAADPTAGAIKIVLQP